MGLRIRALAAALAAFALLSAAWSAAGPAAAVASTWEAASLAGGPINAHLYGVSCGSASSCVAVGGNSTIATSANPNGGTAAWSVFRPAGGIEGTEGIKPGSSYGGGQLRGVSCPSPTLCVAASLDGRIFSSADAAAGPTAWKAVPLSEEHKPNIHMFGVSCPTVSFCVAVGYGGNVVVSTDPTGDRPAWQVTKLAQPYDFRAVSCPTPALCVAVSLTGDVVTSTEPAGGPGAWVSAGKPAGEEPLGGVSCPAASLCVAGNSGQLLISTNPGGGAGAWTAVPAGTGIPISGVSCPSVNACAAVDTNSDVLVSTDPLGGPSAWSFKTVISFNEGREEAKGNGIFALACPSNGLCVGAGSYYQVISSADPFAPDTPPRSVVKRLTRPRVLITSHPAKRVDSRKGGVRVGFRFHAIGKAAYFKCKVRGKRFQRCKSPSHYRVKGGEHVFRVRAIAPGGAKGPTSSFHFRVGTLMEPAPAGSCPTQSGATSSSRGCINGSA